MMFCGLASDLTFR